MESLIQAFRIFRSVSAQVCAVSFACWFYSGQVHDPRTFLETTFVFFVSAIVAQTGDMFSRLDVIIAGLFYAYLTVFNLHSHWSIQTMFMLASGITMLVGMVRGSRKEFPLKEIRRTVW